MVVRDRDQWEDHHHADACCHAARSGLRTDAVGNIGVSLVAAVLDPRPYDVLAVEVEPRSCRSSTRCRRTRPCA